MIKWRDISIKKKFITVFIIQNISLILLSLVLDITFSIGFGIFIALLISMKNDEYAKIKYNKKTFFIITICLTIVFFLSYDWRLIKNVNVTYNDLNNYSGKHISHLRAGNSSSRCFTLQKDEQERCFQCSFIYYDECYDEFKQYFGADNQYGQDISIKYAEFSSFIIPFLNDEKIIYEIKHNDKIIYGYDYFINKFSRQQKNLRIFAVYLILNSVVFCIFYHWIQKDFLKHSQ
ncbi:MAG: hypothetical protein IJV35_04685 [Neisseriaceae bacterium]|nr:hypothetical protein [Neisseriaceae bacterium]